MNEHDIETVANRAATKALDGFFIRLGVDTSDPIAMQKDFAHLRSWREGTEMIRSRGILTLVTVLVTGIAGAAYALVKGHI